MHLYTGIIVGKTGLKMKNWKNKQFVSPVTTVSPGLSESLLPKDGVVCSEWLADQNLFTPPLPTTPTHPRSAPPIRVGESVGDLLSQLSKSK